MSDNCTLSIAGQKASAALEAHPGKPMSAFYTALTSGNDDAADVAVAIALDPLCGINRRSERGEGEWTSSFKHIRNERGATPSVLATPLILAVGKNNISVAERLLEAGADPNISEPQYDYTALHLSPSAEMTALLLRYNADPRATDKNGGTPLHSACFSKLSDIIPLLAAKGCDVNARSIWYGSATLHIAATVGDMSSLTLLLSANADSSLVDTFGNTLLHLAVANNHLEAVAFLASQPGAPLNKRTNDNRTALQRACYNGRPDIVRVLLENNAPFDAEGCYPGGMGDTLSTLLEFGCPASKLLFNRCSGATEPFSMLLDAGCDVDETGRDGKKPLHFAAQNGYPKAISLLVDEGANLHAVDATGRTPLHYAAAMEKDPHFRNDLGLNRLIFLGADVNAVNKAGQTPLHMAADKMRIDTIDALVQQGCNVHIRDNDGQSALDLFEAAIISPDLLMLQTVDHVRHLLATITMTPKRSKRSCVVS